MLGPENKCGVFKLHGGNMREFLIDMGEGDRESEEKDEGILSVHHKIGSLRSAGCPSLGRLKFVSLPPVCLSPPLIIVRETPTSRTN